jgi:type IV secretory pathway VirB9-like protein
MMRPWMIVLWCVGLVGCAAGQPTVEVQGPMPTDDVGWARPVAAELPPEGPAPRVPPRPPSASERLYDYEPGAEYKVDVAVGVPLDIALQPGEVIRHTVGGDRRPLEPGDEQPPWEVREGTSGPAGQEQPHVYVTVTKPGLSMGLTVATDRRDYYLALRSVAASRVRVVRWAYPHDPPPAAMAKPRLWPDPSQPQSYHIGYRVKAEGKPPAWMPAEGQVYDDGRKTYVLFPFNLSAMSAPMIRLLGPSGYELANARLAGSVLILDHLIDAAAELRHGQETVRITRGPATRIDCPRDPRCPVWPESATSVGR